MLQHRGHRVELWLAGKDIESDAVSGWTGERVTVRAEGLPTKLSPRAAVAGVRLLRAVGECRSLMRTRSIDGLLAMGSYASVGPVGAARLLRIPVVLHEANVLPGRANSFLSRYAVAVAGCFQETRYYLKRKEIEITGMPLRQEIVKAARTARDAEPSAPFTLLVMGGSRGAHRLNEVVSRCLAGAAEQLRDVHVIHLTGQDDRASVESMYHSAGVSCEVFDFVADMASLYNRAHWAVCRSGAATCAELSVFALPSLLVPYPNATRDHQTANARALEKRGAADVVAERDLSEEWLRDYLHEVVQDGSRRDRMRTALRERADIEGAQKLADLLVRVSERPRRNRSRSRGKD
jgi:UDP-N-acetylglucosamine--N-acetylmuramyl-(pentapeptide) pyrophosphoryl-undecaprenol N-acetylglucosamine transferase